MVAASLAWVVAAPAVSGAGAAAAAAPPADAATRLDLRLVPDGSHVRFQAKDALGGFSGAFDGLSGTLRLDPTDPSGASGSVRADPATIDTGNGARDANARRTVLEPERYPTLLFRLRSLELQDGALPDGATGRFTAQGELTLHGVTRSVTVSGTASRDGDRIEADAAFDVRLSDYDLTRPRFLFVVVEDVLAVDVHLVFAPAPPGG